MTNRPTCYLVRSRSSCLGDIRSRLVRLIPPSPFGSPLERIANLLGHRLDPKKEEQEARSEWHDIIEGRSGLWMGIPTDRKEVIRGNAYQRM